MSMARLMGLASGMLRGVSSASSSAAAPSMLQTSLTLEATAAGRFLGSVLGVRGLTASSSISGAAPASTAPGGALVEEPPRKYRPLVDKEMWHEAWMYEDRFGTEDDPVIVPSLEPERIIGVTDPDDDNLVVWGVLRDNDPPRQFIEGGEFYVIKKVPYVKKVGDVLDELEGGGATQVPH
ncbi:hypothetical protein FOA52_000768 [Chlamydomonas sp. UWO 241]|nr:hypothetical protein FOA52_000768 [Chlamydomonas sp. UWO 241]